jgi:hypothetical protein
MDLVVERKTFPITGTLTIRLGDGLFDRWQNHEGHWDEGVVVVTSTREILVTGAISSTVGAIPMGASEEVTATLLFDTPEEGEFELALQERIDGLVVGGIGYLWIVSDLVPPEMRAHFPPSGAEEVPVHDPIVVTFTEQMAPPTFQLTLTPEVGGQSVSWDEGGTVATMTHAGFAHGTEYAATIMASDAFANPMAMPYSWSFTTKEGWDVYLPLVIRGY